MNKNIEKRIRTGVRNTTILDPSTFDGGGYGRDWFKSRKVKIEHYSGHPDDGFHLGTIQENHYKTLSDILARNNLEFEYLGVARYQGEPAYNSPTGNRPTMVRFAMTAPGFVWEKYEGITAGGGRNTVYVAGKAMKLTTFLRLPPKKQDALLSKKG